jgi:hypothetical protein
MSTMGKLRNVPKVSQPPNTSASALRFHFKLFKYLWLKDTFRFVHSESVTWARLSLFPTTACCLHLIYRLVVKLTSRLSERLQWQLSQNSRCITCWIDVCCSYRVLNVVARQSDSNRSVFLLTMRATTTECTRGSLYKTRAEAQGF